MLEDISMATELMLVPPVSFELSDTEAAAAFVVPATRRTLLLGVSGANIALQIIDAVFATGFLQPGHANPLLASMHLITAALFVVAIFWCTAKPRNERAWAVSSDGAGMHLGNNAGTPGVCLITFCSTALKFNGADGSMTNSSRRRAPTGQ